MSRKRFNGESLDFYPLSKEKTQKRRRLIGKQPSKWRKTLYRAYPGADIIAYEQYLDHQRSKLSIVGEPIREHDHAYESIAKQRYAEIGNFQGKRVICLGARLAGEVRALKSLGALAVGIDIEPGPQNPDVLYGDFHDIRFPDGSFDVAFANGIDHVFAFDQFVKEIHRILAPSGKFYIELGLVKIGNYEVLDTQDPQPIVNELINKFQLISQYL